MGGEENSCPTRRGCFWEVWLQRARCHQHEDSVPDGVLQGRVPEGAEGSFSCLLALIAHFGNLQSHNPFCLQQGLCATGSCSLLNCWAALRLALPWLWKPPAVWGSEMVAVCSALVQSSLELWFAFPACSVQPWAPNPTEVLVHSSSHRWPQTSNQEQQVTQSKYKVIWDGRSFLVKQRLFSRSGWAGNEHYPSLGCFFSPTRQLNEALDFGCGVPVWRQQFVPVVIRTCYSDSHSYTKDENCLNLLFVVVQSRTLNAEGFPVLQKRDTANSSQCPGLFGNCSSFHYLPGWEGFRMLRSQHFVGRK